MAFTREQTIVPDRRGAVSIVFHIPDPEVANDTQYGRLNVQIGYTDGSLVERKFDLLARLGDDAEGQQLLTGLGQLKNYLLARIQDELLP